MNPDQTDLGAYYLQYWLPIERADERVDDIYIAMNVIWIHPADMIN